MVYYQCFQCALKCKLSMEKKPDHTYWINKCKVYGTRRAFFIHELVSPKDKADYYEFNDLYFISKTGERFKILKTERRICKGREQFGDISISRIAFVCVHLVTKEPYMFYSDEGSIYVETTTHKEFTKEQIESCRKIGINPRN